MPDLTPTLDQVYAYLEAHDWTRRPDDPPGREHWQHLRRDYETDGLTFRTAEVERHGWDPMDLEFFAMHEGRCEHEVLADMLGRPDSSTLLHRIDELTKENQRQASELKALRDAAAAALPIIQAAWDICLAKILPIWRAVEPLLAPDDIPERERLVHDDPALAARIRQGIAEAEAGLTVDRGSFAKYLDDEPDDT
jgi:hypothetical protein